MSQRKVEEYKRQKANRQHIIKKEKLVRRIEFTVLAIVLVALIAWFSVAVYQQSKVTESAEVTSTELQIDDINTYLEDLGSQAEATE